MLLTVKDLLARSALVAMLAALPLTVYADADGDGVPDASDLDADNDGIANENDGFTTVSDTCIADGWLFSAPSSDPTNIYEVDLTTGNAVKVYDLDFVFHGVGYNELTGSFWGHNRNSGDIVTVDAATYAVVDTVATSSNYISGDINTDSNTYVTSVQNGAVRVYDADPSSSTYKQQVATYSNTPGTIADIAYVPARKMFYGVRNGSNILFQLDPSTGNWTNLGAVSGMTANGGFGAAYATSDGLLYLSQNNTGDIYEIDTQPSSFPATLTATVFTNGPTATSNDGARCTLIDLAGEPIHEDADNDGISDYLDLDRDNDGIADMVEAGNAVVIALDGDSNGTISLSEGFFDTGALPNSAAGNGIDDRIESIVGMENEGVQVRDTNSDGVPDSESLDSDGDGIPDALEARATAAHLEYPATIDDAADTDDDGILDIFDNVVGFGSTQTEFIAGDRTAYDDADDSDGLPDYIDTDSDGDTLTDDAEATNLFTAPSKFDPDGSITNAASINGLLGDVDSDSTGADVDFRSINDADDEGNPDGTDPNELTVTAVDDDAGGTGYAPGSPIDVLVNDDFLSNNDETNVGTTTLTDFGSGTCAGSPSFDADNGTLIYTAAVGEVAGTCTVVYEVCNTDPNPDVCDTATVLINLADTDDDGDGTPNLAEPGTETDPCIPSATGFPLTKDCDNDGLDVSEEETAGTDASDPDTDGDGALDGSDANPTTPTVLNDTGNASDGTIDVLGNDDFLPNNDGNNQGTTTLTNFGSGTCTGTSLFDANTGELTYTASVGDTMASCTVVYEVCNDESGSNVCDTATVTISLDTDTDGDGIPDYTDIDNDNDGIPDSVEGYGDSDGDGIANYLDLDSDNDGISDLVESGLLTELINQLDADNDGQIDNSNAFGTNGLADDVEFSADSGTTDYNNDGTIDTPVDTDGDSTPDYLDLDSDADGIFDINESGLSPSEVTGLDSDNDGQIDAANAVGTDGIVDSIQSGSDGGRLDDIRDTDGDGVFDFRDTDSDNDGLDDSVEFASNCTNRDGSDAIDDGDCNNDGTPDHQQDSELITAVNGVGSFGGLSVFLLGLMVLGRWFYSAQRQKSSVSHITARSGLFSMLGVVLFAASFVAMPPKSVAHENYSARLVMPDELQERTLYEEAIHGERESDAVNDVIDFYPGYYIGGGLGLSHVDPEGSHNGFETDDDFSSGFKVYGGRHFAEHWAWEISYADLGEAGLSNPYNATLQALAPDAAIDYKIPAAWLRYLPLNPNSHFAFGLKVGASFIQNSINDDDVQYERQTGLQLALGASVQYRFTDRLFLRLDFDSYDADAKYIGLSLGTYFGGHDRHVEPVLDSDQDGVLDIDDQCHETPRGRMVDENGCEVSRDSDNDGVNDDNDLCPNSEPNDKVDATGCVPVPTPVLICDFETQNNGLEATIYSIQFKTDSAQLTPAGEVVLMDAVNILSLNPEVKVEIRAHTDSRASQAYNQRLSERRAESTKAFLVSQGISAEVLVPTGFGESDPIASNDTVEGRAANRRVEIIPLRKVCR